jgi:hypothetical protein
LVLASAAIAETLDAPVALLFVVTGEPRVGMTEADRAHLETELGRELNVRAQRVTGAAGLFQALLEAAALLESGQRALIVAADSFIEPSALADLADAKVHPWRPNPLRPAECAAAIVVQKSASAQSLADVGWAGILQDEATDDNDEPITGAALTELLHTMHAHGLVTATFGPEATDAMRHVEWSIATQRAHERLAQHVVFECFESAVGEIGAASAVANLVYAIAARNHGTLTSEGTRSGPVVVWGIGRDGRRGLAVIRADRREGARQATRDAPRLHALNSSNESTARNVAVVSECADRLSLLARHRFSRPLREQPRIEQRLLAQLDAIVVANGAQALLSWWAERSDDPRPQEAFAVIFAMGSIPALHERLVATIEDLSPGEVAWQAGLGLRFAPLDRASIHARLNAQRSEAGRIALLASRGVVDETPAKEPRSAVQCFAFRAAADAFEGNTTAVQPWVEHAKAQLQGAEGELLWEAARLLALAREPALRAALKTSSEFRQRLGARLLDLLALTGDPRDLALCTAEVSALEVTPNLLSTLARVGSAETWSFLQHFLSEPELAEAARSGLATMFGDQVPSDPAEAALAIPKIIESGEYTPEVRYRQGRPWSMEAVVAESEQGLLSPNEVQVRKDELRANETIRQFPK